MVITKEDRNTNPQIETAIGTLSVYYLMSGSSDALMEEYKISELSSEKFVDVFIPMIAWPTEIFISPEFDRRKSVLTPDNIKKLTVDDKERIIEAYFSVDGYLLEKDIENDEKLKEDETIFKRLHRLMCQLELEEKKELEKISKSFSSIFGLDAIGMLNDAKNLTKDFGLGHGIKGLGILEFPILTV